MPQMLYRLGQEGADSVKSAIKGIGDEGEAVEVRLAAAAARKASQIEAIEARLAQVRAEAARVQEKQAAYTTGGLSGLQAIEDQRRADAVTSQQMREGAVQAREMSAAYAQLEARARAFVAAIDPAYAAQLRFDTEMRDARELVSLGAISLDQYCLKLREEQALLNQATGAHGRTNVSVGQLRAGTQQLSYQLGDIAQQYALNTPVMTIFAQQAVQTVQAVQLMTGASKGFLGFIAGPWGAVILGGATILGMLTSKYMEAGDAAKQKAAAAKELISAIDALRDSTERQIDSERRQRVETLNSANALLVKAKASRDAALAEYERRLSTAKATEAGALSGEPGAEGAALLLGGRKADVAVAKKELDDYRAAVAKQKESIASLNIVGMQANAVESLDRSAAATARYKEAVDKLNDSFKKTGDRAAYEAAYGQLTRSYNAETATIRESDKAHRGRGDAQREEAKAAREALAEQRQLTSLYDGLLDRYVPLAAAARKYAKELEEIARLSALPASNPLRPDEAQLQQMREGALRTELKVTHPELFTQEKGLEGFVQNDKDQEEAAKRRLEFLQQIRGEQTDSLEMAQAELGLVHANDNTRAAELDKLRLIQVLKQGGVEADSAEAVALLRNLELLDATERKVREQKAAWDELKQFGGGVIDDLFNPDNWDNWGNLGKKVIHDLINELLLLAAINPLKNLLLGQNNPTLGSVLGSLFGLGKTASSGFGTVAGAGTVFTTPGNASGTANFSGGLTWLAENGPELVSLPRGSRVSTAADTRRMMAGNDNQRGNTYINVDAKDAVLAETVRGWIVEGMQIAATQGAAGGAQMSESEATARAGRKLGRTW